MQTHVSGKLRLVKTFVVYILACYIVVMSLYQVSHIKSEVYTGDMISTSICGNQNMKSWIAKVLTDHFSKIEFSVPMHSVWLYIKCTINDSLQKCLHPVLNATHSFSWIAKVLTSTLFGMQKCLYPSIAPPHKYWPIKCFEVCHMIVDMTNLYTAFNQAVVVVLRSPIHANEPSEYKGMLYRTSNRVLNNGIKVIILICMDGNSQYHRHEPGLHTPLHWLYTHSTAAGLCIVMQMKYWQS